MQLSTLTHKKICVFIFLVGLFSCTACYAARGGGGYDHGGYNNDNSYTPHDYNNNSGTDYHGDYYNRGGWGAPAIVIGDPGSDQTYCSTVQQCDSDGNCQENQVCD